MYRISLLVWLLVSGLLNAQDAEIAIWKDHIPGSISNPNYQEEQQFKDGEIRGVSKVTEPTISVFLAKENPQQTAVIIFPGGGYSHLSINKEGYKVAQWLNTQGISAFVVKYRLPDASIMENPAVGPLQDAQEAIRIIRANAEKYHLDPSKIGILGFSAGGHLAATLSTHFDEEVYTSAYKVSARPDFSILIYPVISMQEGITHQGSKDHLLGKKPSKKTVTHFSNETQVTANTPPTFLVHAVDDSGVPVENSINYLKALKAHGVKAEMHLYENGGHGFGLGRQVTNNQWPEALLKWFQLHKILK
ncbi:Acetyl esterase/lipase [Pustulibacterium marinum]|uniref:Acetyl esterase/lipase n=1 Tax=Pustulibacterium marinum TaxID=1224947 RepID=A0A1I7FSL8_9FLAO|nr:alpha/beta hydrolase [Pustulibacterium marinum]SFU39157.1 Acetyl esterase/lipase [Pustulibacterium marinum]